MLLFRLVRSKRVFVITQVLFKENLKVPHDAFHVADQFGQLLVHARRRALGVERSVWLGEVGLDHRLM
jgi:hypothetical protein